MMGTQRPRRRNRPELRPAVANAPCPVGNGRRTGLSPQFGIESIGAMSIKSPPPS